MKMEELKNRLMLAEIKLENYKQALLSISEACKFMNEAITVLIKNYEELKKNKTATLIVPIQVLFKKNDN